MHHEIEKRFRGMARAAALIAALALGTGAHHSFAQTCDLGLQASAVPVEQLTIADFDVDNFESRGLLFTVQITNPGPAEAGVQMNVVLNIALATGETFFQATIMRTDPFPVPPGVKTLTNFDLGKNGGIGFEVFDINAEARAAIEDRALSSGVLPAGVYTLSFTLDNCEEAGQEDLVYDLRNPNRIELISPADGEQTSEYPLFEFFHEGPAARLTVAEILPGQTYEDAITRDPAMLEADLTTERSYLYSGGRPLEQGKSYVWRIATLTRIAGGTTTETQSPIRSFTVSTGDEPFDMLLARLEMMYGSQYPDIFRAIREGKFHFTGEYALDRSTISEAALLELLNTLQESVESAELTFE